MTTSRRVVAAIARSLIPRLLVTGLLIIAASGAAVGETITSSAGLTADIASDGRIALGLEGDIWVVPANGREAKPITRGLRAAHRPRWSADASRIAFGATADGVAGLWVYDTAMRTTTRIGGDGPADLYPAWHPDGQRLVFSSDRSGSGLDLWEVDLPTGIRWRLSSRAGDEMEAAWSADGKDLVYVHHLDGTWSLILRRHAEPEEILLTTTEPLAAPSWRPDGSLIMFLAERPSGSSLEMVILSEPRLVRGYANQEKFERAPVSWRNRNQMVYTADGRIRQRPFDAWKSSLLPFRAKRQAALAQQVTPVRRPLPRIDEPQGRIIIRAARHFDGVGSGYHYDSDIVIEGGRIVAVEPQQARGDNIVIDLGDLTVIPGLIDSDTDLPAAADDRYGALLLTTGVTTMVADAEAAARWNERWSGKETPGPRLLSAQLWKSTPAPAIADSQTPGLPGLLASRQARLLGATEPVARRFARAPVNTTNITSLQLGSRDNGLPPGLALHAELRARAAAGLKPEQVLRAAGVNAAAALGADPFLGRIAAGAVADLVLVDGDPLNDIDDSLQVVAVVRNGRFFSVAGLIQRAGEAPGVE
ncbi:MAG: amidohydrolase family protein [Woeseiaceae bacterium]|nr:amidohydrolase family protein [Woeseiaceae bacterium]